MKFLIVLAILGLAVHSVAAAPSDKVDCSKLEEVLDEFGAAQGMTTLNDKYKLSSNEEEQTKRCAEMEEAIKTLRKYNKECLTALTQQVLSAILRTRSQTIEKRCKAGTPEFKSTVDSQKCIIDNAMDVVRAAERKSILASQVVADQNLPDDKARTRSGCCAVIAGKNFFLDATKEKCAQYKSDYSDYIDSYTSEAFGLICPDTDKLECDKLDPIKTDGVELKTKFFLNPTVKIVKTLDH